MGGCTLLLLCPVTLTGLFHRHEAVHSPSLSPSLGQTSQRTAQRHLPPRDSLVRTSHRCEDGHGTLQGYRSWRSTRLGPCVICSATLRHNSSAGPTRRSRMAAHGRALRRVTRLCPQRLSSASALSALVNAGGNFGLAEGKLQLSLASVAHHGETPFSFRIDPMPDICHTFSPRTERSFHPQGIHHGIPNIGDVEYPSGRSLNIQLSKCFGQSGATTAKSRSLRKTAISRVSSRILLGLFRSACSVP